MWHDPTEKTNTILWCITETLSPHVGMRFLCYACDAVDLAELTFGRHSVGEALSMLERNHDTWKLLEESRSASF